MKLAHLALLLFYAGGMAAGQLLFKLSAQRSSPVFAEQGVWPGIMALATDFFFWVALVLYGALTLYWVWILSFLPLSRAYPVTFFSLVIVTACSILFLHEPLSLRLVAGIFFLCLGIFLVAAS